MLKEDFIKTRKDINARKEKERDYKRESRNISTTKEKKIHGGLEEKVEVGIVDPSDWIGRRSSFHWISSSGLFHIMNDGNMWSKRFLEDGE